MPALHRTIASLFKECTRTTEQATDSDLLAQFAQSRDEVAFAALVERHGPMVLGVCRRVLGDAHTAEDAFQAAFLALTQHVGRIRSGGSLAAWLYGTAVRVSLKARRTATRAHAVIGHIPGRPTTDPLAEITGRELVAVVDEELALLPESLRVAVILCCLEGLSQDEAARRLGWTDGSVKGRLERGRERLRRQLAKRGFTLSAGLSATLVGEVAEAVPPALFARTIALSTSGTAPRAITGLAAVAVPARSLRAVVALVSLAAGGLATVVSNSAQPATQPAAKSAPVAEPKPTTAVDRFGDPLPAGAILRLGTTRLRHAKVSSIAFTAENKLASLGRDYIVRVWDPATGQQLRERAFEKGWEYPSWGGCLSPNARRLAVRLGDQMKVYDTESGRELAAAALGSSSFAAAQFSPDGSQLAFSYRDDGMVSRISLCDIGANTVRDLAKNEWFKMAAFSRDGRRLAVAQGSRGAAVWDVASGRELLRFKPEGTPIRCVDFDTTGDVLASLGEVDLPKQSFHFIRVSTGQPADGWVVPPVGDLEWMRFSPDGSTILMAGWNTPLHWFDPKTGKTIHTATELAQVPAVFSPNGRLVASARWNTLDIWDAVSGRSIVPKNQGDTPRDEISGVAVSPDGKWILTKESESGQIQIWDTSGQLKGSIKSYRWGGRYPRFSADGRHLFGCAPDAIALVRWEFPSGAESMRYTFAEPATDQISVYNVGLSADGRRLAAITQTANRAPLPVGGQWHSVATITVWDVATARRLVSREMEITNLFVGYGEFSPDLRWYFTGDRPIPLATDPEYRLELPAKWESVQAAVSPDGRLVAQKFHHLQNNLVVVHEAATGKQVLALPTGSCGPIAFANDNRSLIVTDPDAITRWDLVTLKAVVRHSSPSWVNGSYGQSFASCLTVTPGGTRAVTGHIDTTALVWELPSPARRVRPLSEKEMAAAWGDLAGADAGKAFAAVWALADGGPEVMPFLRTRLKPVAAPPEEEFQKLVRGLNAPVFADREAATKTLREHGDAVMSALRAAMKGDLSAEQRTRLERLLASAKIWALSPGDRLRQVRAVAVLEQIGTVDAQDVLARLAGGAADARLTQEATAAVERLRPPGR